jgi:hypothetical protein
MCKYVISNQNESALTTANSRSSPTIIERAGFVYGWDQRNIRWNRRLQLRIMGESGEALKVRCQHHGQHCRRETNTLTASTHLPRSWGESFLHSRRTLGCLHVLFAVPADTRRPKNRTRTIARKEPIRGGDGEQWKSRKERGCVCPPFIPLVKNWCWNQTSFVDGTKGNENEKQKNNCSCFSYQGRPRVIP